MNIRAEAASLVEQLFLEAMPPDIPPLKNAILAYFKSQGLRGLKTRALVGRKNGQPNVNFISYWLPYEVIQAGTSSFSIQDRHRALSIIYGADFHRDSANPNAGNVRAGEITMSPKEWRQFAEQVGVEISKPTGSTPDGEHICNDECRSNGCTERFSDDRPEL